MYEGEPSHHTLHHVTWQLLLEPLLLPVITNIMTRNLLFFFFYSGILVNYICLVKTGVGETKGETGVCFSARAKGRAELTLLLVAITSYLIKLVERGHPEDWPTTAAPLHQLMLKPRLPLTAPPFFPLSLQQ